MEEHLVCDGFQIITNIVGLMEKYRHHVILRQKKKKNISKWSSRI